MARLRNGKVGRPRSTLSVALALVVTVSTVTVGYVALGALPASLFSFGFCGGLAAWLATSTRPDFGRFRYPFYLSLAGFALHKLEERHFLFFEALSKITGVPAPEPGTWVTVVLYGAAGLWLLVPFLVRWRLEFGYYLAWTFFTSMGVTELAHFGLPLLVDEPYSYFPGMASVVVLAPLAWWGIFRLVHD